MRAPLIPAPGILVTAIALLVTAVGLDAARPESWVAPMLAGAGSIVLGVWLGVAVTRPAGLLTGRQRKPEDDVL